MSSPLSRRPGKRRLIRVQGAPCIFRNRRTVRRKRSNPNRSFLVTRVDPVLAESALFLRRMVDLAILKMRASRISIGPPPRPPMCLASSIRNSTSQSSKIRSRGALGKYTVTANCDCSQHPMRYTIGFLQHLRGGSRMDRCPAMVMRCVERQV